MTKVRTIISTIRYGSNGFKHMGDVFNLPEAVAKEKAAKGLVEILTDDEANQDELTKEIPAKSDKPKKA
jgi:hypothetical protein